MTPAISIIIPTHNRLPYLRKCLNALASQQIPQAEMEVIVVADGCTDGTASALEAASHDFPLEVISQSASGAAAARNRGVAASRAPLLLFIDDDVIASPGLVKAHVSAQGAHERCVAIGPYLLEKPGSGDYVREQLYRYWNRIFERLSRVDHQAHAGDVMAGNLSMARSTFERAGGFDSRFVGCGVEDHEFGIRLLEVGARIVYLSEAHARHLDTTDLDRSLRRNRHAGSAAVLMVSLHPHLARSTRLARARTFERWLVFNAPRLGVIVMWTVRRGLDLTQIFRLRRVWVPLYGMARTYWYWRGVADATGTERALLERLSMWARESSACPTPAVGDGE